MRSRIRLATEGAEVRRSDSVQPVHSWAWSHMTEGLAPAAAAAAILGTNAAGRPTAAAASVIVFRNSLRLTPSASSRARSGIFLSPVSMEHLPVGCWDFEADPHRESVICILYTIFARGRKHLFRENAGMHGQGVHHERSETRSGNRRKAPSVG